MSVYQILKADYEGSYAVYTATDLEKATKVFNSFKEAVKGYNDFLLKLFRDFFATHTEIEKKAVRLITNAQEDYFSSNITKEELNRISIAGHAMLENSEIYKGEKDFHWASFLVRALPREWDELNPKDIEANIQRLISFWAYYDKLILVEAKDFKLEVIETFEIEAESGELFNDQEKLFVQVINESVNPN